MKTLAQACAGTPLDYSDVQPDGSRDVFACIDGVYTHVGRLMPPMSEATAKASPGIQTWSSPRGKVCSIMFTPNSVASFAEHWERKNRKTYPYSS